ncbi:peptidyl-prolyl cis-trans isomerase [Sporosarcina cyprini]|uniref:peptidyl-prolyl cis-trans isomerase n=1 Tax=Sporosarcina cyprini TaxID=2910523 RepID=UPI001EDF3717|nr:peptidyl-prolyl cis-trans isomerase [Sporosarcina cyprini]
METIIPVTGNVKFSITLDPTVWIFDDRRLDLDTFFTDQHVERDEMEEYKEAMGKHWSREIMEGATFPPTLKTEKKYEKQKMLTGTFGMLLEPFIKNAEPGESATTFSFVTGEGEHTFPLKDAVDMILQYSIEGKPVKEGGPVYVLFRDGSNRDNPIKGVTAIRVD